MNLTRSFCVNLVVFAAAFSASAATLPSDWRHEQSFVVSTNGLVKISLPTETFDGVRPGYADLRLYNDAGEEISYLISRPIPRAGTSESGLAFNVALRPENTVITFETGPASRPIGSVTLETPGNNFLKPVRVEYSDDRTHWKILAQDQPIFSQTTGASHLQIAWPAVVCRWLRLTVDDRRSPPVPFTGARFTTSSIIEPEPLEWLPARISERDENPGETRLSLVLGAANLDLASVQIETSEPLFMRHVTFASPQVAEDSIREQTLGEGTVYRVDVAGQEPSENLSVPLAIQVRSRELIMLIKNGNSAPLPISSVHVARRSVFLVFLARQPGAFHLLTGNNHCDAPHYDLAALPMNLDKVAVSPVKISPVADNPDYKAREVLPGIELNGAPVDVASWRFRKPLNISSNGAQEVELDLDILAGAQPDLADLRILKGSNQVPYIVERTSVNRSLAPKVTATNDAQDPTRSRWLIHLPRAGLPLKWLTVATPTALFERDMSLYEDLSNESGDRYRNVLANGHWKQTPEFMSTNFWLVFTKTPRSDTLFLETGNGDNPPIALEKFQLWYPATRILFKANSGDQLFLYYGNPRVASPRYDLSLVANQLLAAAKNILSLNAEEQLKEAWRHETQAPAQDGIIFWGILAVVVAVLFAIISHLLPKSPPPAK